MEWWYTDTDFNEKHPGFTDSVKVEDPFLPFVSKTLAHYGVSPKACEDIKFKTFEYSGWFGQGHKAWYHAPTLTKELLDAAGPDHTKWAGSLYR